MSFESWYATSY